MLGNLLIIKHFCFLAEQIPSKKQQLSYFSAFFWGVFAYLWVEAFSVWCYICFPLSCRLSIWLVPISISNYCLLHTPIKKRGKFVKPTSLPFVVLVFTSVGCVIVTHHPQLPTLSIFLYIAAR